MKCALLEEKKRMTQRQPQSFGRLSVATAATCLQRWLCRSVGPLCKWSSCRTMATRGVFDWFIFAVVCQLQGLIKCSVYAHMATRSHWFIQLTFLWKINQPTVVSHTSTQYNSLYIYSQQKHTVEFKIVSRFDCFTLHSPAASCVGQYNAK